MAGLTGIDAAKGALDKLPNIVSFPVAVRVLAPGLLATAVLYPLTPLADRPLPTVESGYLPVTLFLAGLLAASLVLGALVSLVLGAEIYRIYEGRLLWPPPLLKLATGWQSSRVTKLLARADTATTRGDVVDYDETWAKLRSYPLGDDAAPYAFRPTQLGNILSEYEEYPRTRYGMDAVFYWPRLWLALEKEKKQDIDAAWSVADGLMALSAVSIVGGTIWLVAGLFPPLQRAIAACGDLFGVVGRLTVRLPFQSSAVAILAGIGLILSGYVWYRLSLPFHRQNGDVFKSLFDLYRDKLVALTRLGPHESATWSAAWLYLQYLWVRCARCGESYRAHLDACDRCFLLKSQTFELMRRAADKTS